MHALLEQTQVNAQDPRYLLENEAVDSQAVVSKTRGCLNRLLSLLILIGHTQQEVAMRLEDRHEAGEIMVKMRIADLTLEQISLLRTQIRVAHMLNCSTYMQLLDSPTEEARFALSSIAY